VVHIFLKNGASLKFKNKTGLASLAQEIIEKDLEKASQRIGFRFKTWLDWDYFSITLYLPKSINSLDLDDIISLVLGPKKISEQELADVQKEVLQRASESISRKYMDYQSISLMVHHSSIYSRSTIGNSEDIESVTADEIKDFMSCYCTVNNSILSVSGISKFKQLKKLLSGLKPCFKTTEYSVEKFATVDLPRRIISHTKSDKKYEYVKISFPSNACEAKKNLSYDLLAQIIINDPEISSMARHVFAKNTCYKGLGVFEIDMSEPMSKTDPESSVSKVFTRLSELSSSIEEAQLNYAKKELEKKYMDLLNNREDTLYALSKALVLCEDKRCFTEYLYNMEKIRVDDIKRILHYLSEDRSLKLFIKMEI
jgi:predicted Zn-dependent peptidase